MNDLNSNSNNRTEGKIVFNKAENLLLLKEKLLFPNSRPLFAYICNLCALESTYTPE